MYDNGFVDVCLRKWICIKTEIMNHFSSIWHKASNKGFDKNARRLTLVTLINASFATSHRFSKICTENNRKWFHNMHVFIDSQDLLCYIYYVLLTTQDLLCYTLGEVQGFSNYSPLEWHGRISSQCTVSPKMSICHRKHSAVMK